jgi:hypothetical protein
MAVPNDMTRDLMARLDAESRRSGMSRSEVLCRALDAYLTRQEGPAPVRSALESLHGGGGEAEAFDAFIERYRRDRDRRR